ncbi:Uncharacterised protein [Klebsiella pneumoniae]|nr:Uncharacterised protein [Klebsiella pneumoniae]
MLINDSKGFFQARGFRRQNFQLHHQTLPQVAGAHTHRVKTLDALEYGFHIFGGDLIVTDTQADIIDRNSQIAGFINRIND